MYYFCKKYIIFVKSQYIIRYCDPAEAHALSFVNINSHDLVEIWNYREYKKFRKNYVRRTEALSAVYEEYRFGFL